MDKRIYSLNLVAYLKMNGFDEVKIGIDEVNSKVYYVFDEDLSNEIERYKGSIELQNFLHSFKLVRSAISTLRKKQGDI
jgi:hypothetical protein